MGASLASLGSACAIADGSALAAGVPLASAGSGSHASLSLAGAIADGTRAVGERAIAGAFAAWCSRHANATSASKAPQRCAISNSVHSSSVVRCDRAAHAARAAPDAAAIAGAVLARSGVGGGATQHRSPPRRTARRAHAASSTAAARAAARTATSAAAIRSRVSASGNRRHVASATSPPPRTWRTRAASSLTSSSFQDPHAEGPVASESASVRACSRSSRSTLPRASATWLIVASSVRSRREATSGRSR